MRLEHVVTAYRATHAAARAMPTPLLEEQERQARAIAEQRRPAAVRLGSLAAMRDELAQRGITPPAVRTASWAE
jgi:hypothetical protein